MNYPKQTDNYDVDIFNQNFREIANKNSLDEANLQDEIARAKEAERANANAISAETSRAMVAEQSNSEAIAAETNRAVAQEALRAPIESPAFTGAPQAPTPETSANDLRIATTAFVKAVVNALIDGAPETLDTLKEVADAIVEHREITDALNAAIGNKVDKISGKGLSSNDYTTEEKQKLFNIESGAEVNVQPDFDVTDSNSDAYIKNKPTIPTKTSQLINDSGFLTSGSTISGVSGVKGNAESNYRTGNVNLTPDNIGAVATANVLATADQINANTSPVKVAGATAVKAMVSQINSKLNAAWHTPTQNPSVVTSNNMQWQRYGRNCIVYVHATVQLSANSQVYLLTNDIPTPAFGYEPRGWAIDQNTGRCFLLIAGITGLYIYSPAGSMPYTGTVCGCIEYICN